MLFNLFLTPSFIILFLLNPVKNIQKEFVIARIDTKEYKMEVANTKFKEALGLMFRDFDKTAGMIFTYPSPSTPTFYNKNVKFPLRIYFLDENLNIVSTYVMQKNSFKTYRPTKKIVYVVEFPLNDDLSNDLGDEVKIEL